ncbi:unnamed protein product [Hermetia illucens]|uniref:Trafficking protein particle complex subunit 6B n=1 Tax=Hermetia illucens TaxID=343691 RepID=A0A7R8YT98_HERIL|nr:unnamed protein product [Hermetia illucens]
MSDDSIFEYLHTEIVNYTLLQSKENDLSTLEYIGYTTGYRLIERLTREWTRFKDELETMKFIWVYVLQDNAFRFLTRISPKHLEHAPKFVAFTCGLVRGSLANLGINSTVTAEVQSMPSCKFHIQVNRN